MAITTDPKFRALYIRLKRNCKSSRMKGNKKALLAVAWPMSSIAS